MERGAVSGFLPSSCGFRFANDFPNTPLIDLHLAGFRLPIGNAADGVCGGMVFATRDLFEAKLGPPSALEPPAPRSPLFRYLVRRSFGSFGLPLGPLRYLLWMSLPGGSAKFGLRGLAWRTRRHEWPLVKGDLDRSILSPLGLVRVRSVNPLKLGLNHQVLAYGYELDAATGRLRVHVYDPNHPDEDTVALGLSLDATDDAFSVDYLPDELPVRGFFRSRYRRADPRRIAAIAG